MTPAPIAAPFPYFGGKSRIAPLVWERIGDVPNYIEPFFGSGACLLARPHTPQIETVNDKDGFVANFWRALQADPETVTHWAENPVFENDLHARHIWLLGRKADLVARLEGDPDYFDAKIAGWWVWGMACWIGSGWCEGNGPWVSEDGRLIKSDAGAGVKRQLPYLRSTGMGVIRKRPHLGDAGSGANRQSDNLPDYFAGLAARLRRVRVCSGDWSRVCGFTPTSKLGLTGVFLDPPYGVADRDSRIYGNDDSLTVAAEVREWAVGRGDDPLMRIALCGYEGEHDFPPSWDCVAWKAHGGYGSQRTNGENLNPNRERVWFSPHCLPRTTLELW